MTKIALAYAGLVLFIIGLLLIVGETPVYILRSIVWFLIGSAWSILIFRIFKIGFKEEVKNERE